jgi:hypothetical protein
MTAAKAQPLPTVPSHISEVFQASAVVVHVRNAFKAGHPDLGVDDLPERYEQRHPGARGSTQGAVVVLDNGDGSVLAEVGGSQVYQGRATTYSDFNCVTESLRQPGSAMKPIVYLAAFRHGDFTLETLVPDEPISVPDGRADVQKWISNGDGQFKGLIPVGVNMAPTLAGTGAPVGHASQAESEWFLRHGTVIRPLPMPKGPQMLRDRMRP